MKVLVTGAAGFIGMHTALHLLTRGDEVVGIDNLNDYYSPQLKQDRLARLQEWPGFRFECIDIAERDAMQSLFSRGGFESVVHLAAQAGVRYSLQNPQAYVDSNLVGFGNVLEGCRRAEVRHLVYASSSSVYGGNTKMPFVETDAVDHPVSLYAATKKANELMAHSYSHLFGFAATGLRFFTVYGPWGRPDMAYFSFAKAILEGTTIDVYNNGRMQRDFTYIDDIVEGVVRVLDRVPLGSAADQPLHRVFNIGNHTPVPLMDFIACLEKHLHKPAIKRFLPMQPGDVPATYADVHALSEWTGFRPTISLDTGLERFTRWYLEHYALRPKLC